MTATDAHNRAVCDFKTGQGNKITLHTADPGVTGTAIIATTPASANTTWGASAMGAGADAGYAVSVGTPVQYTLPASTTATHYGVWNGSTFLRGALLDASLTTNANPVAVDVTPKTRHREL